MGSLALGAIVAAAIVAERRLHPFAERSKHAYPVSAVGWLADGSFISVSKEALRVRDLENPLDRRWGPRIDGGWSADCGGSFVEHASIGVGGERALMIDAGGSVWTWSFRERSPQRIVMHHGGPELVSGVIGASGELAIVGREGMIGAFDLSRGAFAWSRHCAGERPDALAMLDDGRIAAVLVPVTLSGSESFYQPKLAILDGRNGSTLSTGTCPEVRRDGELTPPCSIAFSSHGAMAAVFSTREVIAYDPSSLSVLAKTEIPDRATSVAFHPDRDTLAVGTDAGDVVFLDLTPTGFVAR